MSQEMEILHEPGTRVDSSEPQQQEITGDDRRQHIDELLEVIRGANGMPVLLLTSSGQLSAIAMNGLQNMVPTNPQVNGSTEKKSHDFRAWMLLIASLMATATFTAGLTPPGGFWSDDKANDNEGKGGHVAGTSVMRDKFPHRYRTFQCSNSFTFFYSLLAIGVLANDVDNKWIKILAAEGVLLSFAFLGTSYISGTWDNHEQGIYNIVIFVFVVLAVSYVGVVSWLHSRWGKQTPGTNNS